MMSNKVFDFVLNEGGEKIDLFNNKKTKQTIYDFLSEHSGDLSDSTWSRKKEGLSRETLINLEGFSDIDRQPILREDELSMWTHLFDNMPKENKTALGVEEMTGNQALNYITALMNAGKGKSFYNLYNDKSSAAFAELDKWGEPTTKPLTPEDLIRAVGSGDWNNIKQFNDIYNIFGKDVFK